MIVGAHLVSVYFVAYKKSNESWYTFGDRRSWCFCMKVPHQVLFLQTLQGSLDPSSFITFWVLRFHIFFSPEDFLNLTNIFFRWVETTQPPTSYLMLQDVAGSGSDLWTLYWEQGIVHPRSRRVPGAGGELSRRKCFHGLHLFVLVVWIYILEISRYLSRLWYWGSDERSDWVIYFPSYLGSEKSSPRIFQITG